MIIDSLNTDLKQAMLSGDKQLAEAIRTLKSALLYEQVASGVKDKPADDELAIKVLAKEQKKRMDAIALYDKAGDQERSQKEKYESDLIAKYLPAPATTEEIKKAIEDYVKENSIDLSEPRSMGQIIGGAKSKISGTVDGSELAKSVRQYIQENS